MMIAIQATLKAICRSLRVKRNSVGSVCLTIGAGAGGAVVNLLLAVEPCVACGALAEVASVRVVSTAATVGAGPIRTRHGAQLAVVAIETVRASAGICVFQILWGENRTGLTSRSVSQLKLLQTALF